MDPRHYKPWSGPWTHWVDAHSRTAAALGIDAEAWQSEASWRWFLLVGELPGLPLSPGDHVLEGHVDALHHFLSSEACYFAERKFARQRLAVWQGLRTAAVVIPLAPKNYLHAFQQVKPRAWTVVNREGSLSVRCPEKSLGRFLVGIQDNWYFNVSFHSRLEHRWIVSTRFAAANGIEPDVWEWMELVAGHERDRRRAV